MFPSDVIANWVWMGSDNDHKQAYIRIVMLDDQQKVRFGSEKPVSARSMQVMLKRGGSVLEDDILFNLHLPSFNDQLSVENAERLLSYLTAPYLCIPSYFHFSVKRISRGR